ncbi:S49 family peptidase [Tessaracoccus coleopterorum]|uniref:S49 family peptidase n=1 Tax=Tessaracoccus coleopterorum TaxID=2714950 RepID=UPI0038CD8E38
MTSDYFTAGTGKDFGNPFRAVTEEERAHYQAGIDAEYAKFVSHVSKYRDIPEAEIRASSVR